MAPNPLQIHSPLLTLAPLANAGLGVAVLRKQLERMDAKRITLRRYRRRRAGSASAAVVLAIGLRAIASAIAHRSGNC